MNRDILAACILITLTVPAVAQTKDQCLVLASSLPKIGLPMIDLEKNLGAVNWDSILPGLSGQIRAAAESAKRTQAEFIVALRRYRSALEDTAYQAQLCSR
jgi:hypothetical protein